MFPDHDKTWIFNTATGLPGDPNIIPEYGDHNTERRHSMLRYKQVLVELGFEVLKSCGYNPSTSSWDIGEVDYWQTVDNLPTWNRRYLNSHPWIIFKIPHPDIYMELSIECCSNSTSSVSGCQFVRVSVGFNADPGNPARVIDGSSPTGLLVGTHRSMIHETGQNESILSFFVDYDNTSSKGRVINAQKSSDNRHFRIIIHGSSGRLEHLLSIATVERNQSSLTHPIVASVGTQSSLGRYTQWRAHSTSICYKLFHGGEFLDMWPTCHSLQVTSGEARVGMNMVKDYITNKRPVMDVGLVCETTERWLWLGTIPDFYFGEQDMPVGSDFESNGWHHYESLILPGNGNPLVVLGA